MTSVASRLQSRAAHAGLMVAVSAGSMIALAAPVVADAPPVRTFEVPQYQYKVALPEGCRHEEGPGTLEAVCAPGFDPERSARTQSATALVMEVVAELMPANAGRSASDLAGAYPEAS